MTTERVRAVPESDKRSRVPLRVIDPSQASRSAPRRAGNRGQVLVRVIGIGGVLLSTLLFQGGCSGRRACYDSVDCDCHGREECILGCYGDGCDLTCSHTASSCGAICENDCRFACHDTNHCSGLCEDDCRYLCHHTPSCAGECGARCDYECHDVSECAVRVGPQSSVECRSVALCEVSCVGPCEVLCTNVSRCNVSCAPGLTLSSGPGGRSRCE